MPPAPPAARGWRALLWALVLGTCWMAFDPKPPAGLDSGHDKLGHAFAFFVLAACAARAHPAWGAWRLFAAALAFGAFIELVQTQVPGRSAEWGDLLADAVGAVLGIAVAWLARRAAPPGR